MFTAVRAWVERRTPQRRARRKRERTAVPWRPLPYGQRVLVFDTETTTDAAQRLLFGFFRLYDRDRLITEGLIAADVLDQDAMEAITEYAARCRLRIYSRERFVEEVFYPEVYTNGTLCVGFHLAFDLARIAIHAGIGRGENRRKFRIVLSRRIHWHDLRIESATGKASFMGFVPKTKLRKWERPFFPGRFCDVSMVARAFSGKRHTLRTAGKAPCLYAPHIVPHLLKVEYPGYADLRCFAISAKRYVLYRWRPGKRLQIIKSSESALGAIIGRTVKETTPKLARRIWLSILMRHFEVNRQQRRRAKPLVDFDVPLRRKFPISQPTILKRLSEYNKPRSYDFQVKPFGFVQTVTPDRQTGKDDVLPIAPYETDVRKAMKLQWVDFNTGDPMALDWHGTGMAGTIGVTRLADYVVNYAKHPEAKAAGRDGKAAGEDTIGLLYRLAVRSRRLARIGKEVDRLDEDEGAALEPEQPIEYARDDLAEDIAYLAQFRRTEVAAEIGMTERRWRDIACGRTRPRHATATRIAAVAAERRDNRRGIGD